MKKIETTLLILFFIIGLCSCDTSNMFVGGGTAPDISAPELFITIPENLAYESGTFVIAGTATDNIKVTKVLLTVSRNGSLVFDRNNPPQASITGNYWSYRFDGLESGEYEITATAYDKAGNFSENSSKSIVITVDNEPSTIAIQKPNLKPKGTLEKCNYRDYAEIEYFQNETFSIRGSVDDEYPLKEIKLQLLKGEEPFYSLTFDSKFSQDEKLASMIEGSLYSWTVKIDSLQAQCESETGTYMNKLASLSQTEKHYLELLVTITDKAGNKTADGDLRKGFICLYQEADRPWIEVSSLVGADTFEEQLEKNKLSSGAQITGSAYDDDLLDTLEFCIKNADNNELVKYSTVTKASFGDTSFTTWDLTAPANQGRYRLYYRLKDSSGKTSYGDGADWNETSGWDDTYSIGFQVIDESAPVTEITAFENYPKEAYITEENPAFIIEGITRDSAGISQIMLAWVPDASEEKATSLRKEKWNITKDGYRDGVRYWIVDVTNFENKQENNTFKMEWSCELPVSDFVLADGTPVFDFKKMYYCAVSHSESYAVGTFTIPKEFNGPTLTIDFPTDGMECHNVEGDRFTIEGTCKDDESGVASLIIEYKKSSGEEGKYDVLKDGKLDEDGKWHVSSDLLVGLGGSFQRIVAKAVDKFGNINQSSISIIVDDDSPRVSSITTEQQGYYAAGKVLNFTVTVNKEVVVEGNGLTLELNCGKDVNDNPVCARYTDIEDNKSLKFTYTVQNGDKAEPLDYVSADSLKLQAGTKVVGRTTDGGKSTVPAQLVLPAPGEAGALASHGIFIDTEKPYVKHITANVGEGKYKAGETIEISAQFNENVSGQARIQLNSRDKESGDESDDLVKCDEIEKTDTLEFIYTVKNGDNAETLDILALFAGETVTITDSAGNEMDFSNFPKGSDAGSLASLKIGIDTTAPELIGVYVSDISTEPKDGTYYLNAGKTIRFEAQFSEAIELGSNLPCLELSALNGTDNVRAQYKGGAGTSILSFDYTVANGDNSSGDLTCMAFNGDVRDSAGNAVLNSVNGVNTVTGELRKIIRDSSISYSTISIIIDTKKPDAPTFEFSAENDNSIDFTKNGNEYKGRDSGYIENITVTPKATAGDEGNSVMRLFASKGGTTVQNWSEMSSFQTTTANAEENWVVKAQLVDFAGNTSEISSASFMVDKGVPQLNAIATTLAGGLYKVGTQIPVTLEFSKKVKLDGGSTVTFNNGGEAVISTSSGYLLRHTGTYTVGSNSDSDTNKLAVASISGGTFSDKAGNHVGQSADTGLTTSGSFVDDFVTKTIQIDTKAPIVVGYSVESISDTEHSDNDAYYLNTGDTVKIAVTFDEAVTLGGDSSLALSNGKKAEYSGASSDKKTLYYTYEVGSSGGETNGLAIAAAVYPTNIQDAAGNALKAGMGVDTSLAFKDKTIAVDITPPIAPTVKIYKDGLLASDKSFSEQVTLKIEGEEGAQISYSINSGAEYQPYKNEGAVLGSQGSEKTYYIVAKQVDKAGNTSVVSQKIIITIDLREMGIAKISTTKANGTYKAGDIIPITLLFTKKASFSGLSLTLNSSNEALSGASQLALSHTINYVVADGDGCTEPLKATVLDGTFKDESGNDINERIKKSFGELIDNFKDNTILIDTTAPTVVSYSVESISDKTHYSGSNYYLNAEDTVKLKVTFSEIVKGNGASSVLSLNSGESAVYLSGYGTKELIYEYRIQSGNTSKLAIAAAVYPTNIQDAAGNDLKTGKSAETPLALGGKKIAVDITCAAPSLSGITAGTYSSQQTVTLVGESGAKFYYSYDGGATEKVCENGNFKTPADDGRYQITAYQVDIAGNKSGWAAPTEIIVDTAAPKIKSISTTAGDGIYKAGDTLTITAEFSESVTGNITVALNSGASVSLRDLSGNTASADYTVAANQNTSKLSVASVSGNITDIAGNAVSSFSGYGNFVGKSIKIDTKKPTITKYKVRKYKGVEILEEKGTRTQDVAVDSKIVLQFDEKVSKGSGTITVERIYKSYPAVMEADEYNTHKAGIKNYYIQRCIGTVDNAGAAPDTNAKYVLKYGIDHGAYESNDGLNGEQKAVYDYFTNLDYNVTKIDVNSGLVKIETDSASDSYSLVTIQTPSKLKEGILYKVTFESGTFADEAGNGCDDEDGTSVQFETGPTATPVIRINKLSGRENGDQPFTTTVKISSEMYGATLYYGENKSTRTSSGENTIPSDIISYTTTGDNQGVLELNAGGNSTAAIFRIQAKAEKTGLSQGGTSIELAYKTVIRSSWTNCYVRGSDSSGGVSATTEFPTNWYTSEPTAHLTNDTLISWHILKQFQWKMVNESGDWSKATNNNSTYPGSYGYYEGN